MKTLKNVILRDTTLLIGLGLIVFSLGIFILPVYFHFGKNADSNFGIFALNYLISILFFVIVWIREIPEFRLIHFRDKIEYGFVHLLLCLISAYSLNRELPVFEDSTSWVQIFLMLQGFVLLLVFIQQKSKPWLQLIFWMAFGIVFSFFVYLSFYLIPLYPLGFAAFFVLGISLHALVPLYFVIAILVYLFRADNCKKSNFIGFGIGILLSTTVIITFLGQWNRTNKIITKAIDKSLIDDKTDLPEWTVIAQRLPKNSLSEKVLKTGLVYSQAELDNWTMFDMPSRDFDEVKKHDPFVMIATFFYGAPKLTREQQIKILEAMYDSRHKAQERLWSGDDLQTSHILSNVRIYPNLRIAYTEKIITIRNTQTRRMWWRDQEAIYTFHLPEGSVVTSLSLWINGKEEKAVLTSKHKADTAYTTIVGVERHDPSLVRWQEGNTVSVRIFPCSPDEDRRFKIGITSPLKKESDRLVYSNIWFDGPSPILADETIHIQSMDHLDGITLPSRFEESGTDTWQREENYNSSWSLTFPQIPIKQNAFTFDGKVYEISEYQKTYSSFDPEEIYLDINREWTRKEFDQVRKLANSKKVYVIWNQRIELTDQNAKKLYDQLAQLNFSVFPIYEIPHPEKSLLITKGNETSPNVSDLGESEFAKKLKQYATTNGTLKLFCLNNNLSPYLKTLKELRVFDYDSGSTDELSKLLPEKKFVANQEDNSTIVINDAGIRITEKTAADTISNAPDHLMRLYSYNNVMQQTGTHYFDKDFLDSVIVSKAYKAYVVSPVTSLIVLETAQDYKRFDIKDDDTSLKNASMKSSGAVPEPHEWLLILVLAGVIVYLYMKKRNSMPLKKTA